MIEVSRNEIIDIEIILNGYIDLEIYDIDGSYIVISLSLNILLVSLFREYDEEILFVLNISFFLLIIFIFGFFRVVSLFELELERYSSFVEKVIMFNMVVLLFKEWKKKIYDFFSKLLK